MEDVLISDEDTKNNELLCKIGLFSLLNEEIRMSGDTHENICR